MTTPAQYKTKPLDCWKRAKELRLNHYQKIANARNDGKLLATGSGASFVSLLSGFGDDILFLCGEPYGASISIDFAQHEICAGAAESRGFARDLCAYMRSYWGSMFLDKFYFGGGPFPKPDFCFSVHFCDSHAKWYQIVKEHFGIPFFGVDLPIGHHGDFSRKVEYVVGQLQDAIEGMEKFLGRKFDDEKFLNAVRNEFRVTSYWPKICELNKNVPAPLDQKTLFTLYIQAMLERNNPETVQFYKDLLAEVQDRVANGIAALATERCRILDDSQPLWHFLKIYRLMESYGAVSVGSPYCFGLIGVWDETKDGQLVARKTPEERGEVLKSREDGLRALVDWYLNREGGPSSMMGFYLPDVRNHLLPLVVKNWNVQGVLMHLNRGCEGTAFGQMENRLALMKAGIPVVTYEGNMADKRDFDEAQTIDRIESFMESLGLSKLEPRP